MTEQGSVPPEPALAGAFEAAMDGVAILENGVFQYVNDSHAALYGFDDPSELVGESWQTLYGPDERERFETEVLPEVSEGGTWRGEAVGRRRDGSTFRQEVSLTRTEEERLVCAVRDIGEQYRRRETLQRYERILTNIRDGVYTLDPEGRITWVNQVAVEEFDIGYSRDELIGEPVTKLLSDEDIETALTHIKDLVAEDPAGSRRCEIEIRTADGDTIPCDLHLALLPDESGEFAGTIGVVRDITDRRRRERRLAVLNRVLRHNLRNDINVMLMRLTELAEAYDIDDDRLETVRRKAETLADLGDKARSLQRRLNRLDGRPEPRNVADTVRTEVSALRDAHPDVTVHAEIPETCRARVDETVKLAVENLLENAAEHGVKSDPAADTATGGDGEVTVNVAVRCREDKTEVRIADDGPGIPESELDALGGEEEDLKHGSGFGLWVAKWSVERNDGRLTIDSEPDEGTTATVRLPR